MRIAVAGDLHFPFAHPLYLDFYLDTCRKHRAEHHHLIGDVADHHAISQWVHDANGLSAEDEYVAASEHVATWRKALRRKDVTVSIGNHDERHMRLAGRHGLPKRYLKSYKEIWNTPEWDWNFEHKFDGVLYTHGTAISGKDAAINLAIQRRQSTVIGHTHTYAGVKYHSNPDDVIFGLNAGCGIDIKAYAFAYGRDFPVRPVLGCGIVIDGEAAFFERMPCGRGERYHRSRAGKQKGKVAA